MGVKILIKKRYIFLMLIVCLFAISAVSANEMMNETDSLMIDEINNGDNNLLTYDVENENMDISSHNSSFSNISEGISYGNGENKTIGKSNEVLNSCNDDNEILVYQNPFNATIITKDISRAEALKGGFTFQVVFESKEEINFNVWFEYSGLPETNRVYGIALNKGIKTRDFTFDSKISADNLHSGAYTIIMHTDKGITVEGKFNVYANVPSYYDISIKDTTIKRSGGGNIVVDITQKNIASLYKYDLNLEILDSKKNIILKKSLSESYNSPKDSLSFNINKLELPAGKYTIKVYKEGIINLETFDAMNVYTKRGTTYETNYINTTKTAKLNVEYDDITYKIVTPNITIVQGEEQIYINYTNRMNTVKDDYIHVAIYDSKHKIQNSRDYKLTKNSQTSGQLSCTFLGIEKLMPGKYTIEISNSNDLHLLCTGNLIVKSNGIIPEKEDTSVIINAPNVTMYRGDSKGLVFTVTDKKGNPLYNKEINIIVGSIGKKFQRFTDSNGEASIPFGFTTVGEYDIVVKCENVNVTSKVTVLPTIIFIGDDVRIYDKDNKYYFRLLDSNGNSVPKGAQVDYSTRGLIEKTLTGVGGIVELNIRYGIGKHTITINNPFTGDILYEPITIISNTENINSNITNNKSTEHDEKINLTDNLIIKASDVIKYFGGSERFVVTLKDKNNHPISNADIKIYINGQTYTRTTDNNGIASMAINLDSGKYDVTTEYGGIKVYSAVTVNSTIVANDFTKIFRNDTQYYGEFRNSDGSLLRNTDVKFNINGVFYTRTTNDQGVAKMNINLNPGSYILTATNPTNGEMQSVTIAVSTSIVENYDLTKYYKNDSQYRIRLLDAQGNPVGAGVNVEFNINGVFYTRTSDANGYVKMNINLNPGTYIITANYNGLMASNTIKVLPIIKAEDLVMSYRDGSRFEATLLDGQGKPYANQNMTFNINGVFYTRPTDDNGIARLNINLMAGEYIITSMYENGAATSNKVTIKS